MEFDYTTILYIIFGLIYFAFSSRKKGQKKTPPRNDDPTTVGPPPTRRATFEELLEEFTGKQLEPVVEEPEPVRPEPVKAPVLSKKQRDYQLAMSRVSTQEKQRESGKFSNYDSSEEESNEYKEMFEDLEGTRKAFVLGEIFNRKY